MTVRYESAVRDAVTYHDLYKVVQANLRVPVYSSLSWSGLVLSWAVLSVWVVWTARRARWSWLVAASGVVPGVNAVVAAVLLWRYTVLSRVLVGAWAAVMVALMVHVGLWWTVGRAPVVGSAGMSLVLGGDLAGDRARDAALLYEVPFPARGWVGLLLVVAVAGLSAALVIASRQRRGGDGAGVPA